MGRELYRHFDKEGALLYIGQSLNSFIRLSQHRLKSPWYNTVATVTIERFDSKAAVLEAETKAIKSEHPIHNKKHNNHAREVLEDRADWYGSKIKTQWAMKALATYDKTMSIREVTERTTLSERQIYALIRKEKFPEPYFTYDSRQMWVERDIDRWIEDICAAHKAEFEKQPHVIKARKKELMERRCRAWVENYGSAGRE